MLIILFLCVEYDNGKWRICHNEEIRNLYRKDSDITAHVRLKDWGAKVNKGRLRTKSERESKMGEHQKG